MNSGPGRATMGFPFEVLRCYFIPVQLLDRVQLTGMLASLARDTKVESETRSTVGRILEDVRTGGLDAVFRLTREHDGVALDAGQPAPDVLIRDADIASYRAKVAGRNQVVVAAATS